MFRSREIIIRKYVCVSLKLLNYFKKTLNLNPKDHSRCFLINLLLTSMFHYKKQYYMLRGFLCNSSNSY